MTDAEAAASRLDTWNSRVQWLIVVAAIAPVALALLRLDSDSPAAGVLASVFGGGADEPDGSEPSDVAVGAVGERLDRLDHQLRNVEEQLVALRRLLENTPGEKPPR